MNTAAGGVVLTLILGLAGCNKNEPSTAVAESAEKSPATAAPVVKETSAMVPDAVKKIVGRWTRVDGGYTLALQNPDVSGALEAGYFNPKPIKVSRAIWMQGGAGLQVVVELNDVGYPGATYVLSHEPATDRLVGKYTQPAMQQSFDIEFIRQNAPPLK